LQSRFFPGNAGFQPASEFVGILPAQGGDFIPQPSRRLEACVPRDFAILLVQEKERKTFLRSVNAKIYSRFLISRDFPAYLLTVSSHFPNQQFCAQELLWKRI
ncbi:MAG: hypothetical protein FWC43_13550, partial [Planctomycetaceae bacterium]|nr:hypothetical protein [Planctomycetaceae bacterium]